MASNIKILCNRILAVGIALSSLGSATLAQDTNKPPQILFTNVNVFDGKSDTLTKNANVLVEGNMIKQVSTADIAADGTTVIDGGGRTLMPGLSDTHVHISFATISEAGLFSGVPSYAYVRSVVDARDMLMRGVTSVRDMGGDTFGLKMAIDQGLIPGPRIYPAGAALSQTAGHYDFRAPNEGNPRFDGRRARAEDFGYILVVDGVADMLAGARENLRHGASHIKLAVGGGYASPSDPLEGNQFLFDEIKAAVDTAADWGTYVTVHGYHPSAINRAIDAGIKDVGHGQLLDKNTLQRMADEGVFLSTQPFTVCNEPQLDAVSNAKLAMVCKGTELVYKTAKDIPNLKVTYGTDIFLNPEAFGDQVKMMERLLPWYTPVEILRMATSTAGELFDLSGDMRNPYPDGDLGVLAVGAYADMLLVDGNPLQDLTVVTSADNLRIIMKDGVIYKNTLD